MVSFINYIIKDIPWADVFIFSRYALHDPTETLERSIEASQLIRSEMQGEGTLHRCQVEIQLGHAGQIERQGISFIHLDHATTHQNFSLLPQLTHTLEQKIITGHSSALQQILHTFARHIYMKASE